MTHSQHSQTYILHTMTKLKCSDHCLLYHIYYHHIRSDQVLLSNYIVRSGTERYPVFISQRDVANKKSKQQSSVTQ